MRTLNLRLLAILLVAGLAIGGASHWLHGFQMRRHASFFLRQAYQAEAQGRRRESLDHYRQYLRVRPDDMQARAEYGLLLAGLGLDNQAFSSLEKVLRQSPDRSDIRQELVRISMRRRPPRFRDAIVHLNYLLRAEPEHPELLTLLGRCQAAIGQDDAAVRSFLDVLDLTDQELAQPLEIQIRPEQLDACEFLARLLQERYDRADQADRLMKCLAGSELPRAHILRARYLQARYLSPAGSPEDIQQALTHAQRAVRLASEEISACIPRALSLCVVAPKAAPANGSLDHSRQQSGSPDKLQFSEKQPHPAMRLASLAAQARVARMLAAQCAMYGGDYELARRHAEHLRKSIVPRDALGVLLNRIAPRPRDAEGRGLLADIEGLPRAGDVYAMLAEIELRDGSFDDPFDQADPFANRIDKAIARITGGLEAFPPQLDLRWRLAHLLILRGRISEAEQEVDKLSEGGHPEPLVGYLRARIHIAKGNEAARAEEIDAARENWRSAVEELERIRVALPQGPLAAKEADFWLGECHGSLGNQHEQLAAYRRAVAADRLFLKARIALARALEAAGRPDEAFAVHRQTRKIAGESFGEWLVLAKLSVQDAYQRAPGRPDWTEVDRVFFQAAGHLPADTPDGIQLRWISMNILLRRGLDTQARELFQQARQAAPQVARYRIGLALLAERQGDWEQAEQTLNQAEQELAGQIDSLIELRIARAGSLIRRRRASGDEAGPGPWGLDTLAEDVDSFSPAQRLELWQALLAVARRSNTLGPAAGLCQRILEEDPENLDIWLLRFTLAHAANDVPAMDQAARAIRRIHDSEAVWRYTQAIRLVFPTAGDDLQLVETGQARKTRFREARNHLARAKRRRPQWSRLVWLEAVIDDATGDRESALGGYLQAIELGLESDAALRRAAQLLYAQQRSTEAFELLQRFSNQRNLPSLGLGAVESRVRFAAEDYAGSLDAARKAAQDSEDYADHFWLAFVIHEMTSPHGGTRQAGGDTAKLLAEEEAALRRAAELDGARPEVWTLLVECLNRSKRTPEAEQAIAQAEKRLPPEKAPFALAVCYRILGNYPEAESHYVSALALSPNDSTVLRSAADFFLEIDRPREAERHLRALIDPKTEARPADRAQARRNLAILLAGRAGGPGVDAAAAGRLIDEAIQLTEDNTPQGSSSAGSRIRKAIFLASHPSRSRQQEAVRLLEEMLTRRETSTAEVWFTLVNLHQKHNNPSKAIDLLEKLLSQDGVLPAEARFGLGGLYLNGKNLPKAKQHFFAAMQSPGAELNRPKYIAAYVEILLQRGQPRETEPWLARLRELAPNEWVTAQLTARAHFQRGRLDEAVASLEGFPRNGPQLREFASKLADREQETFVPINSELLTIRCLTAFAKAQLENNRPKQAQRWLARLAELEPDEFSTLSLRSESLFQQGEFDQALELLTDAVGKPGLDAAELTSRRHRAGARMQSFSQRLGLANQEAAAEKFRAQAEAVCRVLARQNPEDELALARFLANQGELDEALDAAERGWPHAESNALAGALGSLLTPEASDEQLRRIEAFATEALEKNQRPAALLLVLADVHTRQDRYHEVEAIYREILAKNADDVAAANNLAILLALGGTDPDEALRLINNAIRLAGPSGTLLDSRATVYLARRRPYEALDDLAQAIAIRPRPTRYFHRAQAYLQLDRKSEAAAAMQEAENLGLQPGLLHPLEAPALAAMSAALK